jgi:ribosome-associated protein
MTTDAKQQTRILVQAAVAACIDKKGEETRILELDPIDSGLSDFFLVTSATNDRQAIAIADEIEHRLKKEFGVTPNAVEGRRKGDWILLDYVDFVVHVFLTERRAFYDIERLRKSARPLTPAEFDAELKTALTQKTVAARKKAAVQIKPAAKARPVAVKAAPVAKKTKPAAKKTVAKAAPVKKAAAKKVAQKTVPTKKSITQEPASKKTTGKAKAIKPAAKKAVAAKNAPAPKAVAKKIAKNSPPAKKAVVKKAAAKKAAAKKRTGKKS